MHTRLQFGLFMRLVHFFMILAFCASFIILPQRLYAQNAENLPAPGTMLRPSPNFIPPLIDGMVIHPENPFHFDFIIDRGDNNLEGNAFKEETEKLIKYFMTALTVPDEEMWVNLSPYEKNRIIAKGLGDTEMGRDMLAQDYLLKQFTASLMYPNEELGNEFWKRIYARIEEELGATKIPTNTFNKIWIVPQDAVVYVNGTKIFVVKSHLEVLLEEDYLALEMNKKKTKHRGKNVSEKNREIMTSIAKETIRKILIPEIEREVNHGKTFANLRQIYNSMILATWYKEHLKSGAFAQLYINKNKINGIEVEDKESKHKIYHQYVNAVEKGVFGLMREDYDATEQEVILRKYFSGGLTKVKRTLPGTPEPQWVVAQNKRSKAIFNVDMAMTGGDKKDTNNFREDFMTYLRKEIGNQKIQNLPSSGSEKKVGKFAIVEQRKNFSDWDNESEVPEVVGSLKAGGYDHPQSLIERRGKEIGRGGNATVFEIPSVKDYLLRVENKALRAINRKMTDDLLLNVQILNDVFEGRNYGQRVISLHPNIQILKRQEGTPAGVPSRSFLWRQKDGPAVEMYEANLMRSAQMPQETYNQLINDLIYINNLGFNFDPSKTNNLLVDEKSQTFNLVDLNPGSYQNRMDDILGVLMDSVSAHNESLGANFIDFQKLVPSYRMILEKTLLAAQHQGFNTSQENWDNMHYAFRLAGLEENTPFSIKKKIEQRAFHGFSNETQDKNDQGSLRNLGGIDFNPKSLNLKSGGHIKPFDILSIPTEIIKNIHVTSCKPVLKNIRPVTNFSFLLMEQKI